jgi:PAS domain S-box-containing protein
MAPTDRPDPSNVHPAPEAIARLLDEVGLGAFSVDNLTGTICCANEAMARIYGAQSAATLVGVTAVSTYADPRERAEAFARLAHHPDLERRGFLRFEARRLRVDNGQPIDLLLTLVVRRDQAGRIVRIDGLAEEAGERRQIEKAFKSAEERFRILFETSTVGMALATPEGRLVRVNQALCRFLERPEGEVRERNLVDFVHPDERATALARLQRPPEPGAGAGVPAEELEWRFLRGDGGTAWGLLSASWLEDDGVKHSRVLVLQDVTRRRQMEEAALRREKLEAVGMLAGGIAHDFNNILASIMGNVEMAAQAPELVGETRDLLLDAERAVVRARELTQHLITFAKGGSPVKKATSLLDLARETADLCLRGTSVRVEFSAPPDLLPVEADPGQIGQVFQNLLANAVEAMPEGGTVRIALANAVITPYTHRELPPGRYVRVDVEDCGVGIPEDRLVRVFDPYYTTKKHGSGLGLAIVQSILKRHAGHVGVSSCPGQGSTFTFHLPACECGGAQEQATPASSQPGVARRTRVLVMDDDDDLRALVKRILSRAGMEVVAVPDGEQAVLEYARARQAGDPFAVVILDLTVVGGMGGLDTLRALREQDPDVRAIVCSGYFTEPVMAEFRDHGFRGVVPKPFSTVELRQAVLSVLGEP